MPRQVLVSGSDLSAVNQSAILTQYQRLDNPGISAELATQFATTGYHRRHNRLRGLSTTGMNHKGWI